MVQLATAYVSVHPDTRGFEPRLTAGIRAPLAKAAGLFAGAFVLDKAVSAGFRFAGDAVFGFNNKLQQATIGFTTMLKSGKKARDFLGQLQKFAARTPFDFPDLVDASERMLAFGFQAKDVIPTLTAVGDAVAGLGGNAQTIDQITTALGQMQAKTKVQSDEMLQLTEAGIPALRILAAGFHTTTARMQDLITAGKVASDNAIPILVRGLEKGTKTTQGFGGMMAKQSHTMQGALSNIHDALEQNVARAFKPVFTEASGAAQGLATFLGSPAFTRALSAVGREVSTGMRAARKAFTTIKGDAGQFIAGFKLNKGALGGFATAGRTARTLFTTALTDFRAAKTAVSAQVRQLVQPLIVGIRSGIASGNWESAGRALSGALVDSLKGAGSVGAKLFASLAKMLTGIDWVGLGIQVGKTAIPFAIGLAAGLINSIGDPKTFAAIFRHWKDILLAGLSVALAPEALVGRIGELLLRIPFAGRILAWGLEAFAKGSRGLGAVALRFVKGIITAIGNGLIREFPGLTVTFIRLLDLIPDRMESILPSIGKAAKRLIDAILSRLTSGGRSVATGAGELVGKLLDALGRGLANAAEAVARAGGRIISGLIGGIRGGFSRLGGVVGSIGGRVVSAAGDFGSLLLRAGENVISGLVTGIKSKIGDVTGAISGVASKIRGFFPFSPPKEGPLRRYPLDKAGRNILGMLVSGMEKGRPKLAKLLDRVLSDVTGKVKASSDEVAKLKDVYADTLSDVRKTAGGRVSDQISTAQDRLSSLRSSYASAMDSVRSGIVGSADATGLLTTDQTPNITALLASLKAKVGQSRTLASQLAALRKRGLNTTTLEQLATGGLDSAATTAAFAAASKAQLTQYNAYEKQLRTAATSAGNTAATQMYGAGIQTAKGLVAGLLSEKKHLAEAMKTVADAMQSALRKALGIHSPSRVFHGLGQNTAAGLINGIDSMLRDVERASGRMGSRLGASFDPGLPGQRTAVTAPAVSRQVHYHATVQNNGNQVSLYTLQRAQRLAELQHTTR